MFGDYYLRELLGRGGMGEVYRAYDTRRGREVALKLLPAHLANDRRIVDRFRREARSMVRFTDPYIVPVHDFGEIDGRLFIDMALVDGRDLGTVLAEAGRMEPGRAVHIVEQAARALDTAHRHEVVHRDVKPSNLLVLEDRGDFTYLADFGIAHAVGTSLTSTGSTVGTLAYMAPERFSAENSVDGRADVYALACVLFQMLTGEHPFPFQDAPALLHAHLNVPPPSVTARRPELGPEWDRVVARGMAKDPADRYPTAGELAADTRSLLSGPATPAPPPPPLRTPTAPYGGPDAHTPPRETRETRPARRRTVLWTVGALVAVAAVVVGIVTLGNGTTSEAPPPNPASAQDIGTTYVTYRDPAGRFSLDIPSVLTSAIPTDTGARLTTPNASVVLDAAVVPGSGSAGTTLEDSVSAFESSGGTLVSSGYESDTYTFTGTDRSGNTVVVRARRNGYTFGVMTWTYPPAENARWAGYVERASRSLTLR